MSHTKLPTVYYRTAKIQGLDIAYREAGEAGSPKLVLLHGFPSSSHQYRDLMAALAPTFHVIAPDYPGFGNSSMPDPASFAYSFDKVAEIIDAFLVDRGFKRFGLYVQDYGGPVGFRIVGKDRSKLEWLVIQNSNAYEVGFTAAWDGFRNALWKNRSPETEGPLAVFLEEPAIKVPTLSGFSSISFTIIGKMSSSIRSGSRFSAITSLRPSSFGDRTIFSSHVKVARLS
jgi:pimeloyl-ACP methyl ester carboxylesterase